MRWRCFHNDALIYFIQDELPYCTGKGMWTERVAEILQVIFTGFLHLYVRPKINEVAFNVTGAGNTSAEDATQTNEGVQSEQDLIGTNMPKEGTYMGKIDEMAHRKRTKGGALGFQDSLLFPLGFKGTNPDCLCPDHPTSMQWIDILSPVFLWTRRAQEYHCVTRCINLFLRPCRSSLSTVSLNFFLRRILSLGRKCCILCDGFRWFNKSRGFMGWFASILSQSSRVVVSNTSIDLKYLEWSSDGRHTAKICETICKSQGKWWYKIKSTVLKAANHWSVVMEI